MRKWRNGYFRPSWQTISLLRPGSRKMRAGPSLSCSLRDARSRVGGIVTCHVLPLSARREEDDGIPEEEVSYKEKQALEFKYYELINIADELSWFPAKRITWGKRTTLAGFVHELRKLRNYVHPGVWAPERPSTRKFTKAVYGVAYEIFEVATSWLQHRVRESLLKRMKRQGLLQRARRRDERGVPPEHLWRPPDRLTRGKRNLDTAARREVPPDRFCQIRLRGLFRGESRPQDVPRLLFHGASVPRGADTKPGFDSVVEPADGDGGHRSMIAMQSHRRRDRVVGGSQPVALAPARPKIETRNPLNAGHLNALCRMAKAPRRGRKRRYRGETDDG